MGAWAEVCMGARAEACIWCACGGVYGGRYGGVYGGVGGAAGLAERIDDADAVDELAVVQVLTVEGLRARVGGADDDEGIPEGERGGFGERGGGANGIETEGGDGPLGEVVEDGQGLGGFAGGTQLAGEGDVEFLQDLGAQAKLVGFGELVEEAGGGLFAVGVALFPGVDEDVGVEERGVINAHEGLVDSR